MQLKYSMKRAALVVGIPALVSITAVAQENRSEISIRAREFSRRTRQAMAYSNVRTRRADFRLATGTTSIVGLRPRRTMANHRNTRLDKHCATIGNDAGMQAVGNYRGGRMLFLGLGTGLGSAMIVDGVLEPMELARLPYITRHKNGRTVKTTSATPPLSGEEGKSGLRACST
jgi:hypothetical protein